MIQTILQQAIHANNCSSPASSVRQGEWWFSRVRLVSPCYSSPPPHHLQIALMSFLSLGRLNCLSSIRSTFVQCERCKYIAYNSLSIRYLAGKSPWDRPRESFTRAKERLKYAKNKQLGFIRENIFTLPNALSTVRIAMTPALGYLVVTHEYLISLIAFTIAGITDVLDGWIARKYPGQRSALGSFLDPMADKLLVATLFVTLAHVKLVPLPLTVLIVSRDALLIIAALFIRYKTLPEPRKLSKFFDISLATAEMKPSYFSKFNTFSQLSLIFMSLSSPLAPAIITSDILTYLQIITTFTTLISGIDYLSFTGYRKYSAKLSPFTKHKRGKKDSS